MTFSFASCPKTALASCLNVGRAVRYNERELCMHHTVSWKQAAMSEWIEGPHSGSEVGRPLQVRCRLVLVCFIQSGCGRHHVTSDHRVAGSSPARCTILSSRYLAKLRKSQPIPSSQKGVYPFVPTFERESFIWPGHPLYPCARNDVQNLL